MERPEGLPAQGIAQNWRNVVRYDLGSFSVFVYQSDSKTGVMAQSHRLVDATRVEHAVGRLSSPGDHLGHPLLNELDWALVDRVRPEHPEAAELLAALHRNRFGELDDTKVLRVAKALLDAQQRANERSVRAALALAADRILTAFRPRGHETSPAGRPEMLPLATYDLQFSYDGHGDAWEYGRGLADAVIRRYPETEWAQMALVEKVLSAWRSDCSATDYLRVIQHGTDWIRRNPGSRWTVLVVEALAQAYETWWSASVAPPHDAEVDFVQPDEHKTGAENARRQAIKWYSRLIRDFPGTIAAITAERPLRHLKLSVDTAQRRYHCAIP